MKFKECASCAAKTGSPLLCEACLHNRELAEKLKEALAETEQLRTDKGCSQREALLCNEHEEMWLNKGFEGCGWCEVKRLWEILTKINKLRDDAVGLQSCGISSFLYPLVAILGDAGIEGEGYDVARERINTIFTQRDEALKLLKLVWEHVENRESWYGGYEEMREAAKRIPELLVQFDALKLQPELSKGEKELEKA